jgi:DNA topoisomerase-1
VRIRVEDLKTFTPSPDGKYVVVRDEEVNGIFKVGMQYELGDRSKYPGGKYPNEADDPLAGEPAGVHRPAAMKRVMSYLETAAGVKLKPHGSVGKGVDSGNDFDILLVEPSDEELAALEDEGRREEDEVKAKFDRGEISRDQMMEELFGEYEDKVDTALEKIGFKYVKTARWLGIMAHRYENESTKHAIELWEKDPDDSHYGLSYREKLAMMLNAQYPPKAGEGTRRLIDEGQAPGRSRMRAPTKKDQARIKALGVPPAWTDVRVSEDPNAALQVTGVDAKGRSQRIYSAEHTARAAAEKFERVKEFHKTLPSIRKAVLEDLKSGTPADRENAAVLYLIDQTGFRVGSDTDTGGDVQAFGATTLRREHVKVAGSTVSFSFTGKKGVAIEKSVTDTRLAGMIRDRMRRDNQLFETDDASVRGYLKKVAGDFKVKDYRTWHGTSKALATMKKMPAPKNNAEFKRAQAAVSKVVAEHLGNTPTVAKASYIDPSVWSKWAGGK